MPYAALIAALARPSPHNSDDVMDAARGDVLAGDGWRGLVWRVDATGPVVLPIVRRNVPLERGDVPLADADMPMGGAFMVRGGKPRRAPLWAERLGRASDALMERVAQAMRRAAETTRVEAMHQHAYAERCVRF